MQASAIGVDRNATVAPTAASHPGSRSGSVRSPSSGITSPAPAASGGQVSQTEASNAGPASSGVRSAAISR